MFRGARQRVKGIPILRPPDSYKSIPASQGFKFPPPTYGYDKVIIHIHATRLRDDMAPNLNIILAITLMIIIQVIPPSNADIKTIRLSSDSRPTILLTDFCFSDNGRVSLSVANVSIANNSTAPGRNNSRFSFLLLEGVVFEMIYPRNNRKLCIADDIGPKAINDTQYIATFEQLNEDLSLNKTLPVSSSDRYSIFFSNCEPNSSVSMSIVVESYNLNNDTTKNYLGRGETDKPKIFFIFALLYLPFIITWSVECHINRAYARKIHFFMDVLLLAKTLNLLCAAEEANYIKRHGTSHFWDFMYFFSYFFQASMFMISVMLIGSGWSIIKQYLTAKQKIVLVAGISFQIFANVCYIHDSESGPYILQLWDWRWALYDILGFVVIVTPIFMSIRYLKQSAKADGTAATTLARMTSLKNFLVCVLLYWGLTKWIGRFRYIHCEMGPIVDVYIEAFTIIFYIVMFSFFRPREESEFLVIQDEEIALARIQTEFEDIVNFI